MRKIDPVVRKETGFIATFLLAGSMLIQGVCIVVGWWSLPVLLGNLLGAVTAVGNFFLMGLMIQRAVLQDKKKATNTVRLSQGGRLLMQGLILVLAAALPRVFNIYTTAIPLLLPRIGVMLRNKFGPADPVPVVTATADEEDED
ncbi:MAG: hypothetical protein IJ518_06370 [Clostridia bacterium]|nr:hypothetical protein [Clostridia bacterium]